MFRYAIVRPPGENYPQGLTTAELGAPNLPLALSQHEAYCQALEGCGVELIRLPADLEHPDSTFVEDTAVLTGRSAVLARPGASSRLGEVDGVRETIKHFYSSIYEIAAPGTLDGGDVCEAGSHVFIGLSHRTNEEGARQLAQWLSADGFTSSLVDIRGTSSILHLKSGIAYLGNNRACYNGCYNGQIGGKGRVLGLQPHSACPPRRVTPAIASWSTTACWYPPDFPDCTRSWYVGDMNSCRWKCPSFAKWTEA